MRPVRPARLIIVFAIVLAGCGNSRTPAPSTGRIPAPKHFRVLKYAVDGVSLRVPTNWRSVQGTGSQLATIAIGDGQMAVWRYARSEPLPETRAQLHAARLALVAQVKRRDPTFELRSSRLVLRRGMRAVELLGEGTNHGERRAVRSLHAYGRGLEVVVDAFAPPKAFARVDEQTFAPVMRSLRLSKPVA
ncbi:MAG: hypothetical protein QOG94_1778 [Solirubrobacteraceae bacterium]|jgi:hypothetical protein|nr:hypothetical protein [Solirubrobacteraceae bacterium]